MRNTLRKPLATITMITAIGMLTPATLIPTAYAADNTAVTVAADQLTQAQAKLDAAKQDVNTKQAAVNQAIKEYDEAKTAYEQALKDNQGGGALTPEQQAAQTQLAKGYLGFIEQQGSEKAKSFISSDPTFLQWKAEGLFNPSDSKSSFNFDNILKSLDYIDQANQYRQSEGVDTLKVSDYLMTSAAATAQKIMVNGVNHPNVWNVSENVGEGSDPYSIEYTVEKEYFDKEAAKNSELAAHRHDAHWVYNNYPDFYEIVGHYLNIVNASSTETGFGWGQQEETTPMGQAFIWDYHAQHFQSNTGSNVYTTAEFRAKLNAYVSKLKEQAGSTGNQTAVDTAKKKLDEAQRKLDQAQQALDAAQKTLEQAQKEYDEIKNNQGGQQPGGDDTDKPAGDGKSVYRLFNPYMTQGTTHLYTTSKTEYDHLQTLGWKGEDIVFHAAKYASSSPVWRLYNQYDGSHHYTTSIDEYQHLQDVGWTGEKIAWYAPDQGKDVYRVYNPYTGEHLFTADHAEALKLINIGWTDEGIAFKTN